jgi:hypothetical protein
MPTVRAEFDGRVFVPCEPLDIPVGTKADVFFIPPPAWLTPEQQKEWQEFQDQIAANPPPVGTFDDYLRYKRGEL